MTIEKMREEFEAWVKSNWPNQSLERFNPLHAVTEGEYTGFTVQHCWDAWQASRAAIVINLPAERKIRHLPMVDENAAYNEAIENCREAIELLGLKVRS